MHWITLTINYYPPFKILFATRDGIIASLRNLRKWYTQSSFVFFLLNFHHVSWMHAASQELLGLRSYSGLTIFSDYRARIEEKEVSEVNRLCKRKQWTWDMWVLVKEIKKYTRKRNKGLKIQVRTTGFFFTRNSTPRFMDNDLELIKGSTASFLILCTPLLVVLTPLHETLFNNHVFRYEYYHAKIPRCEKKMQFFEFQWPCTWEIECIESLNYYHINFNIEIEMINLFYWNQWQYNMNINSTSKKFVK